MKLHEKLLKQICIYCSSDYSKAFDVREQLNKPSLDASTLEALEYLEKQGLIYHSYDNNHRYVVYLTYPGYTYFIEKRTSTLNFWLKNICIPILVSVITTLISHCILQKLS